MTNTHSITDLIVAAATHMPPGSIPHTLWSDWAQQFERAGAFTHLHRDDARTVAAIITGALNYGGETAELRQHAETVARGEWRWAADPAGAAHALAAVAAIVDAL